jgi:alkaline phosphatase D
MTRISRRQFLTLSAGVAVAGCAGGDPTSGTIAPSEAVGSTPISIGGATTTPRTTPAPATTVPPLGTDAAETTVAGARPAQLAADPFQLGVASGDPDRSGAVIWTRLIGDDLPDKVDVQWIVFEPPNPEATVGTGVFTTSAADGHTVHVPVEVDRRLAYHFVAGGYSSPVGFTQPSTAPDELRIASASCQHFETGYYTAHRDIAEWAPDLVLFLGDFIYEGDPGEIGTRDDGVEVVRSHDRPEPTDLDGYRQRYAQYLGDADLRAARAACPWLVIWDDHEVENNYAGLSRDADQDDTGFAARRAAAYRAWWEHMPTRLPPPDGEQPYAINRACDYGELVHISVVDGRQFRSEQACGSPVLSADAPCDEVFLDQRTMLGADQEAWLADRFATSPATWNVLGQQTVFTDVRLGEAILNYDQWDGYPAARQRLLATAPHGFVVITGDIHLAGVGQIGTPGEPGAGVEFVTTSISSAENLDPSFEELVRSLPNIVDAELSHRGSIRHTITAERWIAEYRIVDDVADPASAVTTWRSFVVEQGSEAAVAQV